MQAIRVTEFGDAHVLRLEETGPLLPGPEQALVRLHAAGVNPVEVYIRSGKYARLPALPYTPGTDGAGVVEASNIPGLEPGTRVYVSGSLTGTYAEQAICAPGQIHPLPDRLSFEQGAALGVPYATAAWALFHRGHATAGETVLIHGASGGVGVAAVQLAVAAGLRVLGTAGTPEGVEFVKRHGAAAAFNHHQPGYREEIMAATGNRGLDIILEMAAHVNLGHDLALLAPHGRVLVVGSRGPVEIDPRNLMMRESAIRGVTLFGANPAEAADLHGRIGAGLRDGSLCPAIGRTFPLAEAARAHEQIMAGAALGKMVLTM